MSNQNDQKPNEFVGSKSDDTITDGYQNPQGDKLQEQLDEVDKVNGHAGSDTISTGKGDDLAAGDMVGDEWSFINGKWVYNPDLIDTKSPGVTRDYDDFIRTGDGDDVLLGNGGNDTLYSGLGDDLINAGTGKDSAYGGDGNDKINLEDGDDRAEGGLGNDIVNAGKGDDLVFGDEAGENILQTTGPGPVSFAAGAGGPWKVTDEDGVAAISQSADTVAGEDYVISFELAANLTAGYASSKVEVLWNGEVVGTVEANSGVYTTHEITVTSKGDEGSLTFRALDPDQENSIYDFSGPVVTYDKEVTLGGAEVSVKGFAPGQASLYQVIDGDLKVFDIEERSYVDVGPPSGFKINAVGFNAEDDLIYGVAKSNGVDSLGNPVKSTDIVMIDGSGSTFRVGDGVHGDYVGDFDGDGNLWTFHTSLDRISVVDVDKRDADGNPEIREIDLPNGLFKDRTYDLAYCKDGDCFYAVISPGKNGEAGKVVRIDLTDAENGATPTFREIPITGTLYGDTMESGMAKGAYGAVFLDGDGNLYYGLNKGDHDLDSSTGAKGGIFKVEMDWELGQAYAEFMSEAQSTGSNDGAVDPRAVDIFSTVDAQSATLLRNMEVQKVEGGNDILRGGQGNDEMYGNAGNDLLQGGQGDDSLSGDTGNDRVYGGSGDDVMSGGDGKDKMLGGSGNDKLDGGTGKDYMNGGGGDDTLIGGEGNDKIVGGTGADVIHSGKGNDHMWGGNWSRDNAGDTFVVTAGDGRDYIHDFEVDDDQIDLSSYGLEFEDVQAVMSSAGADLVLDLSALDGGKTNDKLILKSVDEDDLDESNFLL